MDTTTHYDVLNVTRDASLETIKKAYHELALRWHPDKNPGIEEEAQAQFVKIANAHDILSSPDARASYDQLLSDGMRHGGDSYAYGDASWQQHQQQHPPEPPPEPMTWGLLAAWTVTVLCLALGLIWLNRKMEAAARSRRAAEEQAEADRLSRMQELRLKGLEQLRREIQETEEEAARRKAAAGGAKAAEEAAAAQAAEAKKRMRILVAQGELDETAARSQQEVAEAAEAASARSGAAREDAAAALEALEAARRDARDGAQAALSEASAVAAQSRTGTAGSSAAGVQLSSGHSAARAERGAAVFIENKQAELAAATAARERAKHAAALQKLEQRAEEIERQRLLTEAEERRRAEAAASASAYAEAASRSPAVTWGGTGVSVGMGGGVGAVAGPAAGPSPEETARAAARRELLRQQDAEFAESLNRDRDRAAAATRAAELAAAAAAAQDLAMRRHGSLRAKWLATPEPPQGAPGAFAIAIRYPDGSQVRRRLSSAVTLEEVFEVAAALGTLPAGQPFSLATGFPRRLLRAGGEETRMPALEKGVEAGGCLIVVLEEEA